VDAGRLFREREGFVVTAHPASSRPYHLTTFILRDGGELVVLIEKAGDPVQLCLPDYGDGIGGQLILGRGLAIAIGRAIQTAGFAAERLARIARTGSYAKGQHNATDH
jgi:hypothetical protein